MAYFVDTINANGANSNFSSYTISYPPKAKSGDLLILRVTTHNNSTDDYVTPTGWTKAGTTQSLGSTVLCALYYRIDDGTASEVTVSATANTFRWGLMMSCFRDVDQTTPVVTSAEAQEGGTKITFPTVTPTSKSDLYFASVCSNSTGLEALSDCSGNYPFELIGVDGFRWSRSIITSYITGIDSTNATSTDLQLQTNSVTKGSTVLIIKNSTGGRTTPPISITYSVNRKFGDYCNDNTNEVNNAWVDGSGIVGAIDGSAVVTESNVNNAGGGNSYSDNDNPTTSTNGTFFSPTATVLGTWSWWYQSITVDLTGKVLRGDFSESNAGRATEAGFILLDSSNNWSVFTVLNGSRTKEGWTINISENSTPRYSSATAADLTDITKIGTISRMSNLTSDGHFVLSIKVIDSVNILGGTTTDPSTSQGLYHLGNAQFLRNAISAQGEGQILSRTPIQIGDGTRETVFSGNDKSIEFGGEDGVYYYQDSQDLSLTFNSSATDDVSVNSINASSNNSVYDLTNANASATYVFDGTTVAGMKPTLNASIPVNAQKFSNCDTITGAGGTYTNLIVESSIAATNAMQISTGADLTGSTFEKGAETYALELTNAGSYDLSNCTFTGYTNALNITATTGTVSITLADGQSQPAFDTAGATVTFVVPQKSASITGIVAGSRLQIYNVTTASEVANEVVAGTSYTANYTEGVEYTSGDTVRVRLTCQSGTTACDWFSQNTIATSSGWNVVADQQTLTAYTDLGVDGSTVTEYSLDGTNIQVDANDLDGTSTKKRLVAWYYYAGTTEAGIRNFFEGIMLEDSANAKIQTAIIDLTVDNTSSLQLRMTDTDFRLYRDDGATWIEYPSSGGYGIDTDSGKVYAIEAGTGLSPAQLTILESRASQTSVDAIPTNVPTAVQNADAVWNEAYADHTTAGTFGKLMDNLRKANLAMEGSVTANPTTTSFDTDLSDPTGTHDHQILLFVSGTLAGQSRPIDTFTNGVNNTVVLQEALSAAPSVSDEFVILPQHIHPITEIQAGLATATNVTDAQAAIIAEVDANEVKIDALETKVQADARQVALVAEHDSTQSSIAALNNLSVAQVATELATYDAPTKAELDATQTAITNAISALNNLSSADITAAVPTTAEIEAALLNEGDGQQLIDAIVTLINSNLDLPTLELQAIASQVRTELATELARLDVAVSTRSTFDPATTAVTTDAASRTASQADVSALATQLSVDNLNNLSIADIDARLTAFGLPTLAQMTAAFTEIKGATWTTTDTLEAIRDNLGEGGTTPADVWTYATRTLTAGTKDADIDAIKAKTDNLPSDPASNTKVDEVPDRLISRIV